MDYQVVKKSSPSDLAKAGLTGAAIGAGVAIAANKILSDKENREKVKEVIAHAKDKVSQARATLMADKEDAKASMSDKIDEGTEKAKKKADALKKDAKQAVDEL